MLHRVTEKAMRPASGEQRCFYCQQEIDATHLADCVLVKKTVKIRAVIEYEVSVPNSWDKDLIEFQRNEGSWCADNMLDELEIIAEEGGCLCGLAKFKYLEDVGDQYLKEE